MSTTAIGHEAEQAAAEFLIRSGYDILQRNWRTRFCEIDIVAQKDDCIHFIEVKYRHIDGQGSGLEYITKAKLRHMRFAAEAWISAYGWSGEVNLAAIEVSEPNFTIGDFAESIS